MRQRERNRPYPFRRARRANTSPPMLHLAIHRTIPHPFANGHLGKRLLGRKLYRPTSQSRHFGESRVIRPKFHAEFHRRGTDYGVWQP